MTELIPIDIWSTENNITDPIEQRRGYKKYVIGEYMASGDLNEDTNQLINQNFADSLRSIEVSEDAIKAEFEQKETPFEEQLAAVFTYVDPDSEDKNTLREYNTFKGMEAAGTLTEASQQAYAERLQIGRAHV